MTSLPFFFFFTVVIVSLHTITFSHNEPLSNWINLKVVTKLLLRRFSFCFWCVILRTLGTKVLRRFPVLCGRTSTLVLKRLIQRSLGPSRPKGDLSRLSPVMDLYCSDPFLQPSNTETNTPSMICVDCHSYPLPSEVIRVPFIVDESSRSRPGSLRGNHLSPRS